MTIKYPSATKHFFQFLTSGTINEFLPVSFNVIFTFLKHWVSAVDINIEFCRRPVVENRSCRCSREPESNSKLPKTIFAHNSTRKNLQNEDGHLTGSPVISYNTTEFRASFCFATPLFITHLQHHSNRRAQNWQVVGSSSQVLVGI